MNLFRFFWILAIVTFLVRLTVPAETKPFLDGALCAMATVLIAQMTDEGTRLARSRRERREREAVLRAGIAAAVREVRVERVNGGQR